MGREQQASHAFPADPRMSGVHFSVECARDGCRLRDLASSNGTFLNGERIDVATIYDGDEIQAGETVFSVQVKGGDPPPARRAVQAAASSTTAGESASPTASPAAIGFHTFPCRSGLAFLRGARKRFDAAAVARRLARAAPLYVLAAPGSQSPPVIEGAEPSEVLFDWLETDDASGSSPLLLGPAKDDLPLELIAAAWGQDRCVCFFDERPREEILQRLRAFARPRHDRPETRALAEFRPSALGDFLVNGEPETVATLTDGTSAMLLEIHQGERWAVLGGKALPARLPSLGFVEMPVWS